MSTNINICDTSSLSEEPSPYFETRARSKRVAFPRLGAATAKRATAFCFPSLGDIHKGIEEMTEEQIREEIHKARIALSLPHVQLLRDVKSYGMKMVLSPIEN